MTLIEALGAVANGKRVWAPTISSGWVVKLVDNAIRVCHEGTGSSFDFINKSEHEAAEWQLIEGWASYG